jgi:hypothetical protein
MSAAVDNMRLLMSRRGFKGILLFARGYSRERRRAFAHA